MYDFNRITYIVKNLEMLKGLYYFPLAVLFATNIMASNQIISDPLLPIFFYLIEGSFFGVIYYFYRKSFGTIVRYSQPLNPGKILLPIGLLFFYFFGVFYEFTHHGSFSFLGLFFATFLVAFPSFKENWVYRKFVLIIAAFIVLVGLIPLDMFFTFKYDFSLAGTRNFIYLSLSLSLTGICNHFLLLKLMRPIQAESIKNSPVSLDP